MNTPLVSILIPYYNDKDFLQESISSILNQSYKNIELVLLNHASTDGSRDLARSFADERIVHIDMPYNLGYGGSGLLVKEFLKVAKGEYIKLFCADDTMRSTGIETLVDYMQLNPDKDFAFGNLAYVNVKGKPLGSDWFTHKKYFSATYNETDCIRKYAEGRSFLPYIGNIIKRSALDEITLNTTMIYMFDMSLWLELLIKGKKIGFCDSVIANYRVSSMQTSSVKKTRKAKNASGLEWSSFFSIFLKMDNIDLVKRVFCDDKYIDRLQYKEDIPFVVAHYFLKNFALYSYSTLAKMLDDDDISRRLEDRFGFGVRELRKDSYGIILDNKNKTFKKNVYDKSCPDLNIFDLMFLLVRRICYADTFDRVRNLFRGVKDYTV